MAELIKNVEHASIFTLKDLVEIEPGRVNSLTLSQTPGCKMRSSQCSRARAKSPLTTCRTSFPQVNLSS